MANRVWIRDTCHWRTDLGSEDGVLSIDLLWKARTGIGIGTGPDTPLKLTDVRPDLQDKVQTFCGTEPVHIDIHSGMRSADTYGLPTQLNIQGARVSRVRLNYGLIFSQMDPPIPPDYEAVADAGWFEGLIVAPFAHDAVVVPEGSAVLGFPASEVHAVNLDWLWWSRKYRLTHSYKSYSLGSIPFTDSSLTYSEIDTRNGRRLNEYGDSLYWQIQASPATTSAPLEGQTINGGVANWSVLLELPG